MKFLKDILTDMTEYQDLIRDICTPARKVGAFGLSSIHKAHVIYSTYMQVKRKIFIFAYDESEAFELESNLINMGLRVYTYLYRDLNIMNVEGCSKEYEQIRIKTLMKILSGEFDVIVTCFEAALQYTMPPLILEKLSAELSIENSNYGLKKLIEMLEFSGYERHSIVDSVGKYAVRGGIIDFFPIEFDNPVRVEYFGDEIDTMSFFDAQSQRRIGSVDKITIMPASEVICNNTKGLIKKLEKILKTNANDRQKRGISSDIDRLSSGLKVSSMDKFINLIYDDKSTLFNYILEENIIFISEIDKARDRINAIEWQNSEDIKDFLFDGTIYPELGTFNEDLVYAHRRLQRNNVIYLDMFYHKDYDMKIQETIEFKAKEDKSWNGTLESLLEVLKSYDIKSRKIIILAGNRKYSEEIFKFLLENNISSKIYSDVCNIDRGNIIIVPKKLSSGFEYIDNPYVIISYGKCEVKRKLKKKSNKDSKQIYNLSELNVGDYVVHSTHGIGVFKGIYKIEMEGVIKDYIRISYAKDDILYVPVTQLDLVSKYIGPHDNANVKLNNLGSLDWQKSKAKVKKALKDIAKKLIKLYAEREMIKGYAFSKDSEWQHDFESKFEYEETEDQLQAIEEIKSDMERIVPMDRLLCGDVGFGKTEVALRAAFKCVSDSKQCAFLVPTTILSWQHYNTAVKRFEGFPIRIEYLSRFKSDKEKKEILKSLETGEIDIIIGTHRLLQNDVKFKDLGLAIIDEEQRFGVAQKEKFKTLKKNVDILTLSATPIPRTLNMALSGIRDMSSLEEAPKDRRPVQTYVLEHDDIIINEAIKKELRRNGQVYYLYNNVENIEAVADKIRNYIPEAKVGIGHGKMSETELSRVWEKMIKNEINVLICTTIIETGVDLPNANTLIIENADHMGLSQLHQIRGRIGRSSRKAYAYLTFRKNKSLSDISRKRLSAIKEFTEFGSGFKIAMRDLELRGAGNVLGGEQHGNMEEIGYELYIKLLDKAIKEEKGEEDSAEGVDCLIDLQINAYISEEYISDLNQRLDVYKKISNIKNKEEASDVIDELVDRFSDIPKSVEGLIEISLIRNVASSLGIYEIKQHGDKIYIYKDDMDINNLMRVISSSGRQIMINAGKKPYVSMEVDRKDKVLEVVHKFLNELKGEGD